MDAIDAIFRGFAGDFDPDKQTKAMVAGCYLRDGDDLLECFLCSWDFVRNNRSYRSKLFTPARMATECYLKSIIVIYSNDNESPEDAYKAARTRGHSLNKLLSEALARIGWKCPFLRKAATDSIAEMDGLPVDMRYEINMSAAFSMETFSEQILENGKLSGTVGSDTWFQKYYKRSNTFIRKLEMLTSKN